MDRTRAGRQVEYPKARLYGAYSSARRALQDAKECVAYDEPEQALETADSAIALAVAFRDSIAARIVEGEQIWGSAQAEAL
jgi:6-phosphogluconate dehydrogenase (decarboxylating)